LRLRNATNLMALADCDAGWSPTHWQAKQYPALLRDKITVAHDGIDTSVVRPNANAVFEFGSLWLTAADTVITYVARNLEPYSGFHVFMRALPKILRANPDAKVVIVGGDEVIYGKAPKDGVNGVLTDFFDVDGLCERLTAAVRDRQGHASLRQRARATILDRYDLNGVCGPQQLDLLGVLL